MIYLCCSKRRRNAVDAHPVLNGIDFLEVLDHDAPTGAPPQQTLLLRLLKPVPAAMAADNVVIEGGERITPVRVEWATDASNPPASLGAAERAFYQGLPQADHTLVVRTDSSGDHSTYTLRLITPGTAPTPPLNFDPLLSAVDFSFKVECPSDFDCAPERICPDDPPEEPETSYLAKDYASFRRLMLDRIAQLAPAWRDRSPADVGITLVELLAYVGDQLSYQQDAIATEAYLNTARRRISVRRHARLVDYAMHDGANARTWVHVEVSSDNVTIARGDPFLTRIPDRAATISAATPPSEIATLLRRSVVFEALEDATMFVDNNTLDLYTWGDDRCCVPAGATRATFSGHRPHLAKDQTIVFEEVLGPRTGQPEDADPAHRHAVRLVEVINDAVDPLTGVPITEVRWHEDDKLPFPLCVSSITDDDHGGNEVADVSRAIGNIVLVDHGLTITDEELGTVPAASLFAFVGAGADHCDRPEREPIPPRFSPRLANGPLTQWTPFEAATPPPSAAAAMAVDLDKVRPFVTLAEQTGGQPDPWTPQRDLLASDADHEHFVAETDDDGIAWIRFGNDDNGKRPREGTTFFATYRVGNGVAGNVGAESIAHIITTTSGIDAVRNPLPATGGVEPETIEEVRRSAPYAFRVPERAVTPADYETISKRLRDVQRAAATVRWTGSWHTVFVTADRFGGRKVTDEFEDALRAHLEGYRMAGYDLEVDAPRFVSLEIELFICAKPDHFRSDVKQAVLEVMSNRVLPDGGRGVFHPDNFSFAQPVYLSAIYAAAQAVPGVASVEVKTFTRQGESNTEPLQTGVIEIGRLEIARLDNDPDFPEHGVLRIDVGGGK